MDDFCGLPQREDSCPLICIIKTLFFVLIVLFMLFLPLGDPNAACCPADPACNKNIGMCYLCRSYFLLVKAIRKAMEALELTLCVATELLHESKLKLYQLLKWLDQKDLHNSVCYAVENTDLNVEDKQQAKARCCRCLRRRCPRKAKTESQYTQL